jgi:hypothetical protein
MTLPESKVAAFVLLPELKLIRFDGDGLCLCEKVSDAEVCPRCAALSHAVYDHRWVHVRDEPLRGRNRASNPAMTAHEFVTASGSGFGQTI